MSAPDEAALLRRLEALIASGAIGLEVDRRKLSHIDFPLLYEADGNRWVYGFAAATALVFWQFGPIAGGAAVLAGILLYQTVIRARIIRRLERRIRDQGLTSVETWRRLWRFGGVILATPAGERLQGPEGSWMVLVRSNPPIRDPLA